MRTMRRANHRWCQEVDKKEEFPGLSHGRMGSAIDFFSPGFAGSQVDTCSNVVQSHLGAPRDMSPLTHSEVLFWRLFLLTAVLETLWPNAHFAFYYFCFSCLLTCYHPHHNIIIDVTTSSISQHWHRFYNIVIDWSCDFSSGVGGKAGWVQVDFTTWSSTSQYRLEEYVWSFVFRMNAGTCAAAEAGKYGQKSQQRHFAR